METSRVAANEVNANFANGLGGMPEFFKVSCIALTDIGATPGRGQRTLQGWVAAPHVDDRLLDLAAGECKWAAEHCNGQADQQWKNQESFPTAQCAAVNRFLAQGQRLS